MSDKSCERFFGDRHDWGLWEPFTAQFQQFMVGAWHVTTENWQRRVCLRCGFRQEREVRG